MRNADSVKVASIQDLAVVSQHADAPACRDQLLNHRNLKKAAGCNRNRAEVSKLPLVDREEAAGRGDSINPSIDQFLGGFLERLEQAHIVQVRHAGRDSVLNDLV